MEKEELFKGIKEKYEELKSKHNLEIPLEDLDRYYKIFDSAQISKYVPENFSSVLARMMHDTLVSWANTIYNIIYPNGHAAHNMIESSMFSDEEKKVITEMFYKLMSLSSKHSFTVTLYSTQKDVEYIKESFEFYTTELIPKMQEMMKKISDGWKNKLTEEPVEQKRYD